MRFKLYVEETQMFSHVIEVEAESEDILGEVLEKLESNGNHPDDIRYILNADGSKILKFNRDESGVCSFEVPDMDAIE